MRKIFTIILSILLIPAALAAADTQIPSSLSVKVNFNYQDNEKSHHEQYGIINDIKMESNNHQWMIVQSQQPIAKDNNFLLLSKIEKVEADQVRIKFLVLTTGKKAAVISMPELLVRYGQKGQIVVGNKNKKLQLSILVTA